MNYYLLYNSEDLKPISFLAEDIIDRYVPLDGHSISTNSLYFDGIPYLHQVTVDDDGSINIIS